MTVHVSVSLYSSHNNVTFQYALRLNYSLFLIKNYVKSLPQNDVFN